MSTCPFHIPAWCRTQGPSLSTWLRSRQAAPRPDPSLLCGVRSGVNRDTRRRAYLCSQARATHPPIMSTCTDGLHPHLQAASGGAVVGPPSQPVRSPAPPHTPDPCDASAASQLDLQGPTAAVGRGEGEGEHLRSAGGALSRTRQGWRTRGTKGGSGEGSGGGKEGVGADHPTLNIETARTVNTLRSKCNGDLVRTEDVFDC